MAPLSLQIRDDISRSKPYGNHELTPLGWTFVAHFSDGAARVTAENGAAYTLSERPINHGLWKLVLLDDEAPIRQTAFIIGAMSGLACIVALLAAGLVVQRMRAIKQRLANQAALQAANDMLEIRVQERTAELRAAQDELVHAGKLAALGQMSAGMVHELNQPLAALQTAADNAILLVDRGRSAIPESHSDWQIIRRLGRLTGQLRFFAYKSKQPADVVSIEQAVADPSR
jgi:two-component system C4-dicarboxylate transport sensor histidine kinase DctB